MHKKTIEKKLLSKVLCDYLDNFMPRIEIAITLSLDEISTLLRSKKIHEQIRLTWHYKFYLKQLILKTIKEILEEPKREQEEIKKFLSNELFEQSLFGTNETRAIITHCILEFFPETFSRFKLSDIFSGTSLYDDHCAQLAYKIYLEKTE